MRTVAQHPLSAVRLAAQGLGLIVAAVVSGVLAAGEADAWLGRKPALLLLVALVGGTFLVAFSFLGSAAVLIWPVAATGGYLLELPRSHPVITFDRVWIGGLLAYIALTPRRTVRTAATRLLLFALVWLAVSFGVRAIWTDTSVTGPAKTWVDAIVLPTILFVACERYSLLGAGRVRRLAGSLMVAGGILGAIGLAERIFGFELASLTGGTARYDALLDTTRISGPYPAPEPYALVLIVCFAATLYWLFARVTQRGYGWGLTFAALQLIGIGLALFRAGWIAALLVGVATFGFRPGRFGRGFAVTALAVVLALAVTAQLQSTNTVGERLHNTNNIDVRLATYKQGFEMFRSAPLFGIGVDQYHVVAKARPPETVSGVQSVTWPHSSFVGLLAEQGIVGFFPMVLLSYAMWRFLRGLREASFRGRDETLLLGTVTGAVLGYLIMSVTLTMLPYEPSNAFFAALLGAASGRLDAVAHEAREAST